MIFQKYLVLLWVILLASAAVAGDRERTKIKVAVAGDSADGQMLAFDSESSGVDLESMAVGEAHTLTDASGNVATISRTVNGFEVEVGNEVIALSDFDSPQAFDVVVLPDEHENVHVDKQVNDVRIIKTADDDDSIAVVSGEVISETARQQIRDALVSAGLSGNVEFIDGSEPGSDNGKQLRVIRKEIDVTD